VLLPKRHDVHAVHALDFSELVDHLDADPDPFLFLIVCALEPLYDRIRNVYARHVTANPLGRARRRERPDACQDEHLFVRACVPDRGHVVPEQVHVEAVLRLHELRARRYLLRQPQRPIIERWRERVRRRTEKDVGRARQLAAAQELPVIAHAADHAQH
jgi:hypothetical protein